MDDWDPWEIHNRPIKNENDAFLYEEALRYLIDTGDPDANVCMVNLAGFYYDREEYELALKYYEMAIDAGESNCCYNAGIMHYYGHGVKTDYEKAYRCFIRGEVLSMVDACKIMIAVMYKHGHFVRKDYARYCEMIDDMFYGVINRERGYQSIAIPALFFHAAEIRREQGRYEVALSIYEEALKEWKETLWRWIDRKEVLLLISGIVHGMHKITSNVREEMDLYDLIVVLEHPCRVAFSIDDKEYLVEAHDESNTVSVEFDGKWYRSSLEFIKDAEIDEDRISSYQDEITDIRILDAC